MKILKKLYNKVKANPAVLNACLMAICVYCADTRCCWLHHQPKMPNEIKKFQRF